MLAFLLVFVSIIAGVLYLCLHFEIFTADTKQKILKLCLLISASIIFLAVGILIIFQYGCDSVFFAIPFFTLFVVIFLFCSIQTLDYYIEGDFKKDYDNRRYLDLEISSKKTEVKKQYDYFKDSKLFN